MYYQKIDQRTKALMPPKDTSVVGGIKPMTKPLNSFAVLAYNMNHHLHIKKNIYVCWLKPAIILTFLITRGLVK